MARRKTTNERVEELLNITFPMEGVSEERSFIGQRKGTSPDAQNVRAFEPGTDRPRGGRRSGLSLAFEDPVYLDGYHVQDINHLVTADSVQTADSGSSNSPFSYALASQGFGIGSGRLGTALAGAGGGATSGYLFECSCWDANGNGYIAEHNHSTGLCNFYKTNSAGVISVTSAAPGGFSAGANAGTPQRSIVGLTVIGSLLYIAFIATNNQCGIYTLRVSDLNGLATFVTNTSLANLIFSANAHNCLASVNAWIAVDVAGRAATNEGRFYFTNTANTSQSAQYVYVGTTGAAHSKIVTDGASFFYVIASYTSSAATGRILKLTSGGALVWTSSVTGATGIALDMSTHGTPAQIAANELLGPTLLVTFATTKSVRRLSLSTGAVLANWPTTAASGLDAGSATQWDEIDCDNQGFFTLWRNGQGSNDVMGINYAGTTIWGPSTLASAVHYGSSMSKASGANLPTTAVVSGSRQIRMLATSHGEVRVIKRHATTGLLVPTAITGGASLSSIKKVIYSAQNGLDLYFVDGTVYKLYQSTTDSVIAWTPTSGTLPRDTSTRPAQLISSYRGRIFLAGLPGDGQNYFTSAVNAPLNWDYSAVQSETIAFASNFQEFGHVGDKITCLAPWTDDLHLFGCDHSLAVLSGDPAAGGRIDVISHTIGMSWGRPYCIDPIGRMFFFSAQGGVWMLAPSAQPQRMSQEIARRFEQIDLDPTSGNLIRMAWDIKNQGLAVFVTPVGDGETVHYFWEERTHAWQPDYYSNEDFNPFAVHTYDGDDPDDRTIFIGGKDGYVRQFSLTAEDDAGEDIYSYVVIGPIKTNEFDSFILKDLQAIMGRLSGDVRYDIYVGDSAEGALASDSVEHGTWGPGRNTVSPIEREGHAIYIQLSSTDNWSMEMIQGVITRNSRTRTRD